MKTRMSNISAESTTIGDGGIWTDSTCLVKGVNMVMKSIGGRIDTTYQPKSYSWQPKEDITAYELAQCMPVLITATRGFPVEHAISQLPDNCKRHFTEE